MTSRTASDTFDPSQRIGTFIDDDRLEIVGLLGLGAYGAVYLGRHILTRKHYAVKCLNRIGLTKRQHGFQQREIALHQMLSDHPNILTLEKVIHTPECIYMILEYSREGDLFNAITETNFYAGNDRAIRRVFLQIIDAVMYCHHYGVYHRDLKPENILVFEGGTRVKLADFGLATTEEYSSDFGCGSTFYFSPECQGGIHKNTKPYKSAPNDIWSLGVILINLTAGRNPWKQANVKDETFNTYLQDPDFLLSILPITTELNEIVKRIFCVNPEKRIRLHELRRRIASCRHFTRLAISHESPTIPLAIPDARPCNKPRTPPQSPTSIEKQVASPLSLEMPVTPASSYSLEEDVKPTTDSCVTFSTLSSSSWQSVGTEVSTAAETPTAAFNAKCRITPSASSRCALNTPKDELLPSMQTGTVLSDRRYEQHRNVDHPHVAESVVISSFSLL
ncbi:hypothetical protein INT43_007303 [Umbelopsis isabellina]|uniref:Protein kinase domain-containing protein n=1 Tax=Mortierella isabellina TaxID=91625 RepID=A0A8H7PY27_MORIS|nr:hypothetical protein INT43_007303 [Umbelopsis isabellina]